MNTNHLSELWKASLVFGPIFAFLFGLSVNSLFLGFTKYDECSFEPFLPRGLIGFGILGSICSITALFLTIFSFFQVDDSGTHLFYLLYAFIALVGYGLSATILAIATASMLYMKHSSHQSENFHDTQSFCYASILVITLLVYIHPSEQSIKQIMSERNTTTNLTPPIRSIAAGASSIVQVDERKVNSKSIKSKIRDRSSSSSSSISTSSSSNSSTTHSLNRHTDDDDFSSIDDINPELAQLQLRLQTLRRLMPRDSLSSLDDHAVVIFPNVECQVCLEESSIRPLSCCSSTVCSSCIYSHLSSHIKEARIRITCPTCSHIFTREEILLLLLDKDIDGSIAELYKRFYADINHEPNIKTCPQCCALKKVDKKLVEGVRWRKTIPRHVICDECQFNWCFYCHAPWHEKMTCKEYREGEKMLRAWAAQNDNNQQNAQQCPRCKVFISRNGGCPHMICSKCHCDFCYNCGKRRYGIKFLGSHESRFSPFGCKYNLYPDKPILRRTVRGLVAGAATVAAPVAAVGAAAILAVGATIGAPTYGTYRLVKYIRNKRRVRHVRNHSIPRTFNENDSVDDDFDRAIEASLETYREEIEKRDELSKFDHDEDRL